MFCQSSSEFCCNLRGEKKNGENNQNTETFPSKGISHPVVYGRSVTVQRHRHSGNLKVLPTIAGVDAYTSNKLTKLRRHASQVHFALIHFG